MEIELLLNNKIQESLIIIKKMFQFCSTPYIALSFGKDSLVLLDLIYRIKKNVKCLFLKSEETFLMFNYEEVIKWYRKNKNINLHVVETNRLSECNYDWNKARKKGRNDFYLKDFFDNYDGIFMGLRIEESKGRKYTITKKENNIIGKFIMRYSSGKRKNMYRCCPIAKWKSYEIMLYLKEKNLRYLDIYLEGEHMRTTARITGDAHRSNVLFWIQKNKPENWSKIITILPELKWV